MGSTFIIIYSIIVVVFIVILFVVGLFTNISPSFILITMYVFVLFIFIMTAGYAADAAAKTGGVDDANKEAHTYYTWAAVISWIIIGIAIILIIGAIILAIFGGGEAAAAGEAAAESGTLASGLESQAIRTAESGITKEAKESLTSKAMDLLPKTPENEALQKRLKKEERGAGGFFHSTSKSILAKGVRGIMYILLFFTTALAMLVGILLAIGASKQGKSESQKGVKKAAIGATMSILVASAYIIFFFVMFIRGRNLNKRLHEDLIKQHDLITAYNEQKQINIDTARGDFAKNLLLHHTGLGDTEPQVQT